MVKYRYMIGGIEVSEEEYRRINAANERKLKRGGYQPARRVKNKREFDSVMDAHNERHRKWYGEKEAPPVIEDYRHPDAAKSWPGYKRVLTKYGWKEGPPPFKSKAEESLYQRTYGFVEYTGRRREDVQRQQGR